MHYILYAAYYTIYYILYTVYTILYTIYSLGGKFEVLTVFKESRHKNSGGAEGY